MPKLSSYEKKLNYNNAYNRENYKSFAVRFSNKNESKIIRWLMKQPSTKAYIKELIIADMEKNKKKTKKAKK